MPKAMPNGVFQTILAAGGIQKYDGSWFMKKYTENSL